MKEVKPSVFVNGTIADIENTIMTVIKNLYTTIIINITSR